MLGERLNKTRKERGITAQQMADALQTGRLLLGVTLCIAVATAMVGPISFIGLIMANLARQFLKTFRHRQLILASTLFGMAIMIGGELIVERVYHYAVPISVFIGVFGGIYFLYLLLTNKKM